MTYDISQISALLADKALAVCEWLLPGGRKDGPEWRCGNVQGEKGNSLAVRLGGEKAGVWRDFATDEGGDLIDLIAAVRGLDMGAAVKEAKSFLNLKDEPPKLKAAVREKPFVKPERPKGLVQPSKEMLDYFKGRGISEETLRKACVGQICGRDGKPVMVFPYIKNGELTHLKFRPLHDKKGMYTSKDSRRILFGWHTVPDSAREVAIVEGEIDQLSFLEQGIPALSVPNGGGADGKQDTWLAEDFEALQRFSTIYLALDADKPGQEAADYLARRLGQHRCLSVDFGPELKDANGAVKAGIDLHSFLATAKAADPEELVSASDCLDSALTILSEGETVKGRKLPWHKTHGTIGISYGETVAWMGISGHGKSQLLGHVVVDSVFHGERWCVASMEYRTDRLMSRLVRQMSGKAVPGVEEREGLLGLVEGRLWFMDAGGSAKEERIFEVFEYAYRRYGVRNFLIDSLAKCGFREDDYSEQKRFVEKISDFARRSSVTIHIVCHSRKKNDENDIPNKFDLKGSGGITDMVDDVFVVWRNKPKEQTMSEAVGDAERYEADAGAPDCVLVCCKQRENGWEGAVGLWLDRASLQYVESFGDGPQIYTI